MSDTNNMNEQELRLVIEEAYKQVNKDRMLSSELKELLNFAGDGKAWGGLIFRLMREKIIEKDSEKPVRNGTQRYHYYKLLNKSLKKEEVEETKEKSNEFIFVIFNETTSEFVKAKGDSELNEKIESILAKEDSVLRIFRASEVAKRTISRDKIN